MKYHLRSSERVTDMTVAAMALPAFDSTLPTMLLFRVAE